MFYKLQFTGKIQELEMFRVIFQKQLKKRMTIVLCWKRRIANLGIFPKIQSELGYKSKNKQNKEIKILPIKLFLEKRQET